MNQEKIGNFIRELRKDKNMTQQELADKLGVTNKSISKWETGRCLMDLSLIKPLCEVLDITILELLNGEKIDDTNIDKISNETLERTLIYTKGEVNKTKRKTKLITICLLTTILVSIYIIYQSFNLVLYSTDNKLNEWVDINIDDKLVQNGTTSIYKKTIPENEYINFENVRFENHFNDLEMVEPFEMDDFIEYQMGYYKKYNISDYEHEMFYALFSFRKRSTVTSGPLSRTIKNHLNKEELVFLDDYLLENNIDDEIELYEDFKEKGYQESNLFTTINKMRFNQAYNYLRYYMTNFPETGYTLIDGDYRGLYYELEVGKFKSLFVTIYKRDYAYEFEFNLVEKFSKEEAFDIISTLEIR